MSPLQNNPGLDTQAKEKQAAVISAVTDEQGDLSPNLATDCLSSWCYDVLIYLQQCDFMVATEDIAEQIAAWNAETEREGVSDERRKQIAIRLYHADLPRLKDAGLIEFDSTSKMVALTPKAKRLLAEL